MYILIYLEAINLINLVAIFFLAVLSVLSAHYYHKSSHFEDVFSMYLKTFFIYGLLRGFNYYFWIKFYQTPNCLVDSRPLDYRMEEIIISKLAFSSLFFVNVLIFIILWLKKYFKNK